jgi:hypothetical protein
MGPLLQDFAIATEVCPTSAKAVAHLSSGATDLVIVDWQNDSAGLVEHIERSRGLKKPTVVIVSEIGSSAPGTYSLLRKPVTIESGTNSLKAAYSKMLHDYRRHTRYAVMASVVAKNQYGRSVPINVVNIGEGGIGLATQEFVARGDVLSFCLLLPGMDAPIGLNAKVLWTRQYGAVGCEFVHIGESDSSRLRGWLEEKCLIKKPLTRL